MTARRPRLTPLAVGQLTDQQAFDLLRVARWPAGGPVCPDCGCTATFTIQRKSKSERSRAPTFRCRKCFRNFSVTAGIAFANVKLPLRVLLYVVSVFATAPTGISAEHLAHVVGISPTTARVLQHKLREVMGREQEGRMLSGKVEADGCFIGGHNRPKNVHEHRDDRRRQRFQVGAKCVFAVRQRKGPTLVVVVQHEKEGRKFVLDHVEKNSTIFTDSASHFTTLAAQGKHYCINHKQRYFRVAGDELVHTNTVESFFNRLRDAEHIYGHIGGAHLFNFAVEQAWRQDHRKKTAEEQFMLLLRQACTSARSVAWTGYWQRRTGRNKTRRANPLKVRNALRRWQLERIDELERAFGERLQETCALPVSEEGTRAPGTPNAAHRVGT